jgi:hypothetical protein
VTRLGVEDWSDTGGAGAANEAFGNGQVGTADQRSVHFGESMERAVAEADRSRLVASVATPSLVATGAAAGATSVDTTPPTAPFIIYASG